MGTSALEEAQWIVLIVGYAAMLAHLGVARWQGVSMRACLLLLLIVGSVWPVVLFYAADRILHGPGM